MMAYERMLQKGLYLVFITSAMIVMFLSLATMFAWNFHWQGILQAQHNNVAMVYNTAFGFLISATLLLLLEKRRKIPIFILATFLMILSTIVGLEILHLTTINIDQIFINQPDPNTTAPGQMSPVTVIVFFLWSIIGYVDIFIKSRQKRLLPMLLICFLIFSSSVLFLFSHTWDIISIYKWSVHMPFSWVSSMCLFFLSLSGLAYCFLTYRRYGIDFNKSVPYVLGLIILFMVLVLAEAANQVHEGSLAAEILIVGIIIDIFLIIILKLMGIIRERAKGLEISEARLLRTQQLAKLGYWTWHVNSDNLIFSENAQEVLQLDSHEMKRYAFISLFPEKDQQMKIQALFTISPTTKTKLSSFLDVTLENEHHKFYFEISASHFKDGEMVEALGLVQDLSEITLLEDKLSQTQRLEVLGQLTGGIAHDFNNILMIIQGNLELVAEKAREDKVFLGRVNDALIACHRGGDLIKHLLSYARKQMLKPSRVNLKELIPQTIKLMKRTLGEGVAVSTKIPEDAWPVWVDPAQFETALLNLAINARDAMNGKGKLLFEVVNVIVDEELSEKKYQITPGRYVKISISDTGAGIPEEHLQRVTEPFFTTKGISKGSGLGLSMVFGFVKQSNGHMTIYSEEGHGTTINLFLPDAGSMKKAENLEVPEVSDQKITGKELIGIVEDEASLRQLVYDYLTELGYSVWQASNGESASSELAVQPNTALLFTDIILPGNINGVELGMQASEKYPKLKLLYSSGYTKNAMDNKDIAMQDVTILNKPYSLHELALTLRHILDEG